MADTQKKAIGIDELSHFKAKQDLENYEKFQPKGSSDLAGAVRYDVAQALTEEQKAQARFNIGAGTSSGGGDTVEGAVRHDVEQSLDEDDKARARANIGITDENGLIPTSMLPSFVDDVIEGNYNETTDTFTDAENQPITPEGGKIYVDLLEGGSYRWGGSQYVRLNPPEITFATTSDIDALFT